MEHNPTTFVILGMLARRPMCGYEIKAFVDSSTRFFWAAGYGQIYPELRRLTELGLIEGERDPASSRRRIEFRLTEAGRAELQTWLARPAEIQEMRDESLLKVFLSDAAGPARTEAALRAKAEHHRSVAGELRTVEAEKSPGGGPGAALRFGIAFSDFAADWCEREAEGVRGDAVTEEELG